MSSGDSCLGVCFTEHQLFYAACTPGKENHLERIGCIDFNFDVENALFSQTPEGYPAVRQSIESLRTEFNSKTVRILTPAPKECWTVVPRPVYEDSSERESHIELLMRGTERQNIQAYWHPLSKNDLKLLVLRDRSSFGFFHDLLTNFSSVDIVPDFEIALDWQFHTESNESFLIIHCHKEYLSISSFVLGNLRGCTFIEFESIADLPYLWNLYAEKLSFLNGIHDKLYLYGTASDRIPDLLQPYWYDHGEVITLNTLQKMNVDADERTYSFRLEGAFPAILLSLNKETNVTPIHENHNR